MNRLLLLSNSSMPGQPFFAWPQEFVRNFLGTHSKSLVFIPFAAVKFSFDEYEEVVRKAFNEMGYKLNSVHRYQDKVTMINDADAIVVGGGNTFALLFRLYQENMLEHLRAKLNSSTPYIGWSAGANLACPTIMTTNDMPIVQPPSFQALNLVPFQLNPHYHELKFQGQGGETRKERLEEFLEMNTTIKVIGLPEGMLLQKENNSLQLRGTGVAKLYQYQKPIQELEANTHINFL